MVGGKKHAATADNPSATPTRIDRLVALIDHCNAAKDAADELDEKFLAYLLGMAIQEATAAMRWTR